MKLLLILLLTLSNFVFAAELEVKVYPKNPVFNEPFEVEFIISSSASDEPIINFDPYRLEIESRTPGTVSSRTTYINGKMTYERKIKVKYQVIASKPGFAALRNIKVEVGRHKLKHKNVSINVLRKAAKPLDIFVEADVEKEEYYIGESILVRYYLYYREGIPLNSFDIKKFPKLDKLLKRFHQEKSIPERVNYKGRLYVRRVIYTAQLFGEKPGKYKIDPISMRIRYSDRSRNNLNNFGFGINLGRMKTTSKRSKTVEIEVIPLPLENVPPHFTGLVGKHKFTLKTNKQKFLSNEPIELELEAEGEGALELFEAPKLLTHDLIEEFETNADLKINPNFTAKKKFEYTYLGRGDVNLEARKFPLSYFDPDSKEYVTADLELGSFKVVNIGANPTPLKNENVETQNNENANRAPIYTKEERKIDFTPIYKTINSFIYHSKHLIFVVGGLLLILLTYLTLEQFKKMTGREKTIFEEIYAYGIDYARLHHLVGLLGSNDSMEENIKLSGLTDGNKTYLLQLIDTLNAKYDSRKELKKFKVEKRHLQDIEKYITKRNEDIS